MTTLFATKGLYKIFKRTYVMFLALYSVHKVMHGKLRAHVRLTVEA